MYTRTAIVTTYAIVISVGIWRSATKYAVLYPNRNGYATLAKICVVLGALSIPAAYVQMASNDTNSISALPKATSPAEQMQYQALISGLNADLPKMIDPVTRLNKIDLKSNGYIYYETITKEIDNKEKDILLKHLKPVIASGLCKNIDTLKVLTSGLNYTYIYSDLEAQPIGEITVTKLDCAP